MTAFVLGNGVSRQSVDVDQLLKIGNVYGCNALYRTHTPTALIATDAAIAEAIQKTGYSLRNRFYTRRPIEGLGALTLIDKYRGFSSGPNALSIAATDGNRRIYLLGFDMGPTETGQFNNVYADTEFYKKSDALPTFTGNWVKQICTVISDFPAVEFVRVCGPTTAQIPELDRLSNLKSMLLPDFVDRINTAKDL